MRNKNKHFSKSQFSTNPVFILKVL